MGDRPASYVHQRLVVKKEVIVLQSLANAAHPVDVLHHPLALFARHVVELDAIPPVCFRGLAGHVGLSDELVRAEPRRGDCGDSNAALKMEHVTLLDVAETPHLIEHLLCNRSCLGARDVSQQHNEFVAAEARDKVIGANAVAQLLRSEPEQLVAGGMSAGIVDVLELIEVDEAQGAARSFSAQDAISASSSETSRCRL